MMMHLGQHYEAPAAVVASFVAAITSGLAVLWQWGVSLANAAGNPQTVDQSVLITGIVTLFASLSALAVWVGTKFQTKMDDLAKATAKEAEAKLVQAQNQAEGDRAIAASITKLATALDGLKDQINDTVLDTVRDAVKNAMSASYTLGSSPEPPTKRRQLRLPPPPAAE